MKEENPEFIKNHSHSYCGIFKCCVNKAYWKRFVSCYYHELNPSGSMICDREEVIEGWGGRAYCNECWFHATKKDIEAGRIPE